MDRKKLVVIGGDAAGMSAASKVRRSQPDWEIVVYERSPHTSYSACGIPYLIGGIVEAASSLIARSPETFWEKHQIQAKTRHEVEKIDPKKKRVMVKNLATQRTGWETYDYLLIATGTSPIRPEIPGVQAQGVFSLSTLQSGILAKNYVTANQPKRAVIVGGGYIGLEMAEALLERGLSVSLIDRNEQVMGTLDKDMGLLVSHYLEDQGVQLFLEESLTKIQTDAAQKVCAVETDKRTLDAELVILGIGVKPNSELAADAGIQLCDSGTIAVNDRMETSEPGIWAAGDCASSRHLLKNKDIFISLGTVANKHGLVAGSVIASEKATFPGVLGTAITKFKDMEIARTGLSETEAVALAIPYQKTTIESSTIARYYPGSGKITVKLLCRKDNGLVLGAQIAGAQGAAKRIDTVVAAIQGKLTVQDLVYLDLAYAPPFSGVWDPIQIAARQLV
ncbi:Pyridine nucleotide-disulfide oxidoreductase [Lunatimonas lonarensis]|uniref:Pyridine nucleotide-disulfide oxidoreductase n=1 Tax=Lunatimonas lonarensis TaxID=1232681 RepID=R7ZQ82_9BACT|nr:FAD-dependent oxidoreductase [Lunatimonas lonarensis]EON76213.1 Pyridine nucleotide-disulfide oxidoreductase [Lunatimonas lonarensis]